MGSSQFHWLYMCVNVHSQGLTIDACAHLCLYECLLLCVCFFYLISESTSQLCREMPLRHDSGHMAPLVRIRHLSKSNCTVEKLNCARMITGEQRTTKALKISVDLKTCVFKQDYHEIILPRSSSLKL